MGRNDINKDNMYRKRECELCGAFAFEKYIKELASLDGGFTKVEQWEESGFGTIIINYWDIKSVKETRVEYDLCPNCAKKLDSYMHSKIEELKMANKEANNEK